MFIVMNKETIELKDTKKFCEFSHKVLEKANHYQNIQHFFHDSLSEIIELLECEKIDILLLRSHYYFFSSMNKADNHIFENISKKNSISESCKKFFPSQIYSLYKSFFENDDRKKINKIVFDTIKLKKNTKIFLVPIFFDSKLKGFTIFYFPLSSEFESNSVDYLTFLTNTLLISLDHLEVKSILNERIKELTCLYGIAQFSDKNELSLDEILRKIVEILPSAWQFPEIANARIALDQNLYVSDHFELSEIKQSAHLFVDGVNRGFLEVNYPTDKISSHENPFLPEEEDLINTIAREISVLVEKRQTEEEKAKLHNQLRHADRLATIGQLSAGVAHELNEPLGNILGFAQLLKKSNKLDSQMRSDVEGIINASLHAREVIKKLMLFSRQMPTQKTMIDLNQIVENGLYFLASRCEKNGIKLIQELSEKPTYLIADSSQLHQVLVNLVVNAIQAMNDDGELLIKTYQDNEQVFLVVKDSGVGMDQETLRQIFIPFYTTKDISEGTGLGLAVVHGIIKSHQGSIQVKSKKGAGTTFLVAFPAIGK